MARTHSGQNRIAAHLLAAGLIAFSAVVALAGPVVAQTAMPMPMPHLSPTKPATTETAGADPLLEGANSSFAEPGAGGARASDGDTAQTAPPELRPTGDVNMDASGGGGGDEGFSAGDEIAVPDVGPPPNVGPPSDIRPGTFTLEARLAADDPPLGDGVKWRIYGDTPGTDGHLPLLGEADGGIIYIRLDQGAYYVHAAYGRAGATRKIEVNGPTGGEVLVLNAGGMRLLAINAKDQPLGQGEVAFDIYAPDEGGSEERFLLIPNAPPGHVIPLNAGTYHVVSKYGDSNAVVRADVKVDPGKLTEATVFQQAARLTLKLVEQHGGEAIADTAWSVVMQGGESVLESVGAFPSVVLAAGDYTAIAKHDGRRFETNFTVQAGANRDIEVLAE